MKKPTNWTLRPAKTQINLGIRWVFRVFSVRMEKVWVLNFYKAHEAFRKITLSISCRKYILYQAEKYKNVPSLYLKGALLASIKKSFGSTENTAFINCKLCFDRVIGQCNIPTHTNPCFSTFSLRESVWTQSRRSRKWKTAVCLLSRWTAFFIFLVWFSSIKTATQAPK